jgi:hypothetical protein
MPSLPRKLLLALSITLMLFALAFTVVRSVRTQSITKDKSQDPDPVVAAIRRGGLREAARIKGHYVSTERTTGWMKYDLESLTQNSSEVILGTPIVSSSNLVGSGDGIVTEYRIRIDQILKGKLNEKRLVSLEVPGGKVTFDDGTSAEIKTPDLGPIEEYKSYVMFLKPRGNNSEVFGLTGGGQGLFELSTSDSMVKPRGDKADIVQKHKNQQVSTFLEEVKLAVKRYPGTTPCCN